MACNCIEKVNQHLAAENAKVMTNLLNPTYAFVTLYKVDEKKRGKLPLCAASFCPFCGTEYGDQSSFADQPAA